ncbi:hypothetical protein DSO57_1039646 [Entomophthora muscae]|uniref:Uncharacterized protein n=1 Tax=Entomophthora muscae TaxID=34485 RepID=A0ACC2TVE7_9FUNG|nr:hypothetical protein DSO57_1039646 [Entomophthora muscae]
MNWLDSLCPIPKENQTLQNYLAKHQGVVSRGTTEPYWRRSMRALRLGEWNVLIAPKNNPHCLANEFIRAQLMNKRTTQEGKDKLQILVDNALQPVTCKGIKINRQNLDRITKRVPKAQFPHLVSDWALAGTEITLTPKQILDLMQSKFTPIKSQSTSWQILNRAYKSGTHCNEFYWYRECKVCPEPIAGVEHRYFNCQSSAEFWKRAHHKLLSPQVRNIEAGKDVFFNRTMGNAPAHLKALYYHCTLTRVHSAR